MPPLSLDVSLFASRGVDELDSLRLRNDSLEWGADPLFPSVQRLQQASPTALIPQRIGARAPRDGTRRLVHNAPSCLGLCTLEKSAIVICPVHSKEVCMRRVLLFLKAKRAWCMRTIEMRLTPFFFCRNAYPKPRVTKSRDAVVLQECIACN